MADPIRTAILPAHIEGTVESIARLHAEHRKRATPFETLIEDTTAPGWPPELPGMVNRRGDRLNIVLTATGHRPLDEAPFAWLSLAVSLAVTARSTVRTRRL